MWKCLRDLTDNTFHVVASARQYHWERFLQVLPDGQGSPAARRFWATFCKMIRPMLSDRCLSCLSVTLVYCGQTVRWIKLPLGIGVGLGRGHIVLDGDPSPSTERDTAAPSFAVYKRMQACVV